MSKKLLNLLLIIMMLAVLVPTTLAAPPAQEEGQDYIVTAGDWLSKLADKYLGNPFAYPAIVEYTNQKHAEDDSYAEITDPELIEVGWKIYIPSAEEAAALDFAPTPSCSIDVIATVDPGELESAPPPVAFAEDALDDFMLYHPTFREYFDVEYTYDIVPPALDIATVEVRLEGEDYHFHIEMAGENVRGLFLERPRTVQFGVFVDTDLNGLSDFLLTTMGDPELGVVVSPDFERVDTMPLEIDNTSVTMSASIRTLGEHGEHPVFDWAAFTGYSPVEEAYYLTPLEDLFIVPIVDMAYADIEGRETLVSTSLFGINPGKQCQITDLQLTWCPPKAPNPPAQELLPGPTPDPSKKGWMYWQKKCGDLKIELWCYGAFGRRVEKGSNKGWIARCPFDGGRNRCDIYHNPPPPQGDGMPYRVHHWVTNGKFYWGFDDDKDKCWDWMDFDYFFNTNLVTIVNKEYQYAPGEKLVAEDPDPASPHKPYDWPSNVPDTHKGAPVHPPGSCPTPTPTP